MKYHLKYFFLFFFFSFFLKGQVNFVPNPSFEDTVGNCFSQMGYGSVKYWSIASQFTTPDYYNNCANSIIYPNICTVPYSSRSYQNSHSGNAYMGMGLYYILNPSDSSQIEVEYITVKLKTALLSNKCYYSEFHINLGNISNIVTNQIGLLLTQNTFTTSVGNFTNTIQPQVQWDTTQYFTDTLNWVKISGTFLAQGGEQYLTIGNFKDGTHLKKHSAVSSFTPAFGTFTPGLFNYILIDDVSLYELPTTQIQSNAITICPNADTLVLGDTARIETRYQWFANGTAIDTTSFIKVKPNQTTTYVLQSTNCTTTTQTIVVTYSANCTPPEPIVVVEPIIPNVFTPNNDSINDVWRFSLGKGNVLKGLNIFNRWGNIISAAEVLEATEIRWDGRTTAGEETPSGVYFYVLQYTDANGEGHKKNGYITLIK
jgi:gliding motility-associated-like protein